MKRWIYETLHPEIYHGHRHRRTGWYYRLINATEDQRYASYASLGAALPLSRCWRGIPAHTLPHSPVVPALTASTSRCT